MDGGRDDHVYVNVLVNLDFNFYVNELKLFDFYVDFDEYVNFYDLYELFNLDFNIYVDLDFELNEYDHFVNVNDKYKLIDVNNNVHQYIDEHIDEYEYDGLNIWLIHT